MSIDLSKVYSDNPFVDELVYELKILAIKSIIKNETEALKNETLESVKQSDLYISSLEGRTPFELFTYTYDIIKKSSIPYYLWEQCAKDNRLIPEDKKEELRQMMMKYTIETYEEKNNYYRTLIGLPKIGQIGLKVPEYYVPANITIDTTKYIHEMSKGDIEVLYKFGILDRMLEQNPDHLYLKYIYANLDLYTIRRAYHLQLLYVPTISNKQILSEYKTKYEINKTMTIRTIYSEAYKFDSDYYDNFIIVFIVVQTIIDMISEIQEYIARKEIFDNRCIQYIFESYGVPYYREIPLKFQLNMMYNLNKLLKYKSSPKCMVEICSLFGFDNIKIFKYYLLRDRNLDSSGEYQFNYLPKKIQNGKPVIVNRENVPIINGNITITFPFEDFLKNGNKFLVIVKNKLVSDLDYYLNGNKLVFKNTSILDGETSIEIDFIFTEDDNTDVVIDYRTVDLSKLTDKNIVNIPLPFDDFLKNGNYMFLNIASNVISDDEYDIFDNNKVAFDNVDNVLKYGNVLSFIFVYDSTEIFDTQVEDYGKNYDLKFVKIPILEQDDKYIRNKENYLDYDVVTEGDVFWDGEIDYHDAVRKDILEMEFSYARSKYISIDTVYEMAELSFDISYFFNILWDDVLMEDQLKVFVPYLSNSKPFRLNDLFCYMFALGYAYNDIADDIIDTTSKCLSIKGFNFRADLAKLKDYLEENGFTMEKAGIDGFIIPKTPILTFNALLEMFTKNKSVYKFVIHEMVNASNKNIYDIYKKIYESLMTVKLNFEFFKLPNGKVASSFTEFLRYRDETLYASIIDIKTTSNVEDKQTKIITIIQECIYALEEFIDSDKYRFLYKNLPGVSADMVLQYIVKIINFFKSYKVYLLGINTIYIFNDKLQNTIRAYDRACMSPNYEKKDKINVLDTVTLNNNMIVSDKIQPLEKVYLDISTWSEHTFKENMSNISEKVQIKPYY